MARNNFSHNLGFFCRLSINSIKAFTVSRDARTSINTASQREGKWFSVISRNISKFAFHFSNGSDEHFRTKARANENQQIHFNRSFPEIFFFCVRWVALPAAFGDRKSSKPRLKPRISNHKKIYVLITHFNDSIVNTLRRRRHNHLNFSNFHLMPRLPREKPVCSTGTRAKIWKINSLIASASHKIKELSQWITGNVNTKCDDSVVRDFFCFTSTAPSVKKTCENVV